MLISLRLYTPQWLRLRQEGYYAFYDECVCHFGFFLIIDEFYFVEIGIISSVILLGFAITIEKNIPKNLIMLFVGIFGLFHGIAHGIEVPAAANPLLFVLGFICGTTALHIFGVGIGYFSIKTTLSLILLRVTGVLFAAYGFYLFNLMF